jgi:hypothetical protein
MLRMTAHGIPVAALVVLASCAHAQGPQVASAEQAEAAGPVVHAEPLAPAEQATSPEAEIIDGHLIAYNRRDLDAFMAFIHEEIEIYFFPGEDRLVGKEAAAKLYGALFAGVESLEARIEHRSVHDGMVVDTERVFFRKPGEEQATVKALAVYQIKDQQIFRLWLIPMTE